tara:strand:+ start:3450 stop:3767 length:318 start_codon:yes stop_codon:yes gene_type:complete
MTHLLTEVIAASKFLVAGQTTSNLSEPTRLILQCLLSTYARLLNQEWTFWTLFTIFMALMLHLRMAAGSLPGTFKSALGRLRTAWLRWLQNRPTTSAANILKNGF